MAEYTVVEICIFGYHSSMNVEALVIGHEAVEVGSALKITECTSPSKLFTCDTRSTVTCHENDAVEVDTTVDLKA